MEGQDGAVDINETDKKNLNRRRAFRIYEQVNIFYQKIDSWSENDGKNNFNDLINHAEPSKDSNTTTSFEQSLPDSESKENDSLNVNISSTGISFTSKEEMAAGDYLMVRVFLLSTMTVIMTCFKVVYCKPSNPYEKNLYPYLLGGEFVNLKPEDQEILQRHIKTKKNRRLFSNIFLSIVAMVFITMPEEILEIFLDLSSAFIDQFVEIIHVMYELFEYSLDLLIEHSFHTGFQATQTIVFYIQLVFAFVLAYAIIRRIPAVCMYMLHGCSTFCYRKKSSILYRWNEHTLLYKIGFISLVILMAFCYLLFFI